MRRYLASACGCFLITLAVSFLCGEAWALLLLPVSALSLLRKKDGPALLRCLLCGILSGLLIFAGYSSRLNDQKDYVGQTLPLSGYVLQTNSYHTRFTVAAEIDGKTRVLSLTDTRRDSDALAPGETFSGTVTITATALESDTLFLSGGTALEGQLLTLEDGASAAPNPLCRLIRLRETALYQLSVQGTGADASLAIGMLTADLGGVSPELRSQFSSSGIAHILAVSGLHLSILTALIVRLCDLVGCSRRTRSTLCLLCCLLMVVMAGFSVSVLRAALMTGLVLLAGGSGRESDGLTSLSFAAALLALCNPAVLADLSYWLTCTATLGILLFARPIKHLLCGRKTPGAFPRILVETFSVSLAAQLGTLPVTALSFGYLPAYSLLTNLLILPLVYLVLGFDLIALLALAVGLPCTLPLRVAAAFAGGIRWIAAEISALPGAVLPFSFWWQICPILLFLLLLWGFGRAGSRQKRLGMVACGCMLAAGVMVGSLWLEEHTLLTVDHETGAVLLQKEGKAILLEGTESGYEATLLTRLWMRSGAPEIVALYHPAACHDLTQELRLCRSFSPRYLIGDADAMALGKGQLPEETIVLSVNDTHCNILSDIAISNYGTYATELTFGTEKVLKCWAGYDIITAADLPADALAVIDRAGNLWFREEPIYRTDWRQVTVILLD